MSIRYVSVSVIMEDVFTLLEMWYDNENKMGRTVYMDILSSRLKALRQEKGIDQGDISKVINLSRSSYSTFENGVTPQVNTIIALADYFDVSVEYLLGISNDRRAITNEFSELFDQIAMASGSDRLTAYSIFGMLQELLAYYQAGAPAGNVPLDSLCDYMSAMKSLIIALSSRDIPTLLDSVNDVVSAGMSINSVVKMAVAPQNQPE